MAKHSIFLLSPAHCGGRRAELLMRPEASFELVERFRASSGASLGEVFSFLSGLYFRGKIAYADRFSAPPPGMEGMLVITTNRGLLHPGTPLHPGDLAAFGSVGIDLRDERYRLPLESDVRALAAMTPADTRFVLLGSIATAKYVELLLESLGERLCFPEPFIGMGDMQRGALLLRAAERGEELPYVRASGAVRSRAAPRSRKAG